MKKTLYLLTCLSLLNACAADNQNQYSQADIGKQIVSDYGKIIHVRNVKVQHESSGAGELIGTVAGGGVGSAVGSGDGGIIAIVGGAVIGAVAGAIAEQGLQNKQGIEYTIVKNDGKTITIVQNIAKVDEPLRVGDHVIIQSSGNYQRVLLANALPEKIK